MWQVTSFLLLSKFSLYLWLLKMCSQCVLVWVPLTSSYLEFIELPGCLYSCLPSNLEGFGHHFFCSAFSLSRAVTLNYLHTGVFDVVPQVSWFCPFSSFLFFNSVSDRIIVIDSYSCSLFISSVSINVFLKPFSKLFFINVSFRPRISIFYIFFPQEECILLFPALLI